MNKAELIDAIAAKTELTKKDSSAALDAFLDVVQETVANGGKVTLVGFGTFENRVRQGRQGRNPQTGESIAIAAKNVPAFSAGKLFREKVG